MAEGGWKLSALTDKFQIEIFELRAKKVNEIRLIEDLMMEVRIIDYLRFPSRFKNAVVSFSFSSASSMLSVFPGKEIEGSKQRNIVQMAKKEKWRFKGRRLTTAKRCQWNNILFIESFLFSSPVNFVSFRVLARSHKLNNDKKRKFTNRLIVDDTINV